MGDFLPTLTFGLTITRALFAALTMPNQISQTAKDFETSQAYIFPVQ